ncbi:MAG: leucine-rich repeat domain-containing protein [Treponema sp.]
MFAVSCRQGLQVQKPESPDDLKKITITIEADEGYESIDSKTPCTMVIDKEITWNKIKAKAQEKITIKTGYKISDWTLGKGGALLIDSFVFSSNIKIYANSIKEGDPEIEKISITVSGDENVEVAKPNIIFAKKGAKWGNLKATAESMLKIKESHGINEWCLDSKLGKALKDDTDFQSDVTVFAVTRSKKEIILRIDGDERLDITSPNYISITEAKTFIEVEALIKEKLKLKKEWSNEYYEIYDYRNGNEEGEELKSNASIADDITIYVRTNYKKFKLEDTILKTYEGEKPRGRIIIPKKVTVIDEKAFYNLPKLTAVNFRECPNLTKIGYAAFYKCFALEKIDFTGCSNLVEIAEGAFVDCSSLTNIDLSPCVNLTQINKLLFTRCSKLESVNLQGLSKITEIKDQAFSACSSLKTLDLSQLPKLTKIGLSAFFECKKLESVNLTGLNNVIHMGDYIFTKCSSLVSIDLSPCYRLSELRLHSFSECSKLENVNLTGLSHLREIQSNAFFDCSNLKTIDLSPLKDLEEIGSSVFYKCGNLESINLTGLDKIRDIGLGAFSDCSSLTKIDLSSSPKLSKIEESLFWKCAKLKTVILSDSPVITAIGNSSFRDCPSLESLDLSGAKQLTNIDNWAFYNSTNLVLKLPSSITTLGKRPFGKDAESWCKKILVPNDELKTLVKGKDYSETRIETYTP